MKMRKTFLVLFVVFSIFAAGFTGCDAAPERPEMPELSELPLVGRWFAAPAEAEEAVEEESVEEPVVEEQAEEEVVAVAPTATPVPPSPTPMPTPTPEVEETKVYTYTPGGENYAWPEEGAVEEIGNGWARIRQAANGQYLPWTFFVRVSDPGEDVRLQWDSATKLLVAGPGEVTIELMRDITSTVEIDPDPYEVANAKDTPLGLGWFVSGNGAEVVVGGSEEPVELTGIGVYQMNFPKMWEGVWEIKITVEENGQVILNQGERWTQTDNWELPPD